MLVAGCYRDFHKYNNALRLNALGEFIHPGRHIFNQSYGLLQGGDHLYLPLPAILAHESRRGTIRLKTGFPGRESFKSAQK